MKFRNLTTLERDKKLNCNFLKPSLNSELLDKIGENPIGIFELPIRILNNLQVNGKTYNVPMVTEEASVVAGACYGAKLCGNITAKTLQDTVMSQIFLLKKPEFNKQQLIEKINSKHSYSKLIDIQEKKLNNGFVLDLIINPGESMGAAVASKMAETLSKEISEGVGKVISNKFGRTIEAIVSIDKITNAKKIELLSNWAKQDESRAVSHNKGIMNGVIAIALATGQDTRAIEAACHFIASKERYSPLSEWYTKNNKLHGKIKLTIPCGIIGGELKTYSKAQQCLNLMNIKSSNELAQVITSVGLVQNLAALNMLAGIGVTKGHGSHRK